MVPFQNTFQFKFQCSLKMSYSSPTQLLLHTSASPPTQPFIIVGLIKTLTLKNLITLLFKIKLEKPGKIPHWINDSSPNKGVRATVEIMKGMMETMQ